MKTKIITNNRATARLAAVQAAYMLGFDNKNTEEIILDFISGSLGGKAIIENGITDTEEFVTLINPDHTLFASITRGVSEQYLMLTDIVNNSIDDSFDKNRLERLFFAILICAAFELKDKMDVPAKVVINEYVDIAKSFYNDKEPAIINAIIDKIAKVLRKSEV